MTSQLFESSSLEEALAEVRETVGPHARIVRAEKVRRGGIGGFFTKESFVLSVEASDDARADEPVLPVQPSLSLRPLAAVADVVDTPAAYTLDALADSIDDLVVTQSAPVSTETPLFGQVLRDVSRATALDSALDLPVDRALDLALDLALDPELPAGPRWDGRLSDLETVYGSVMPTVPVPAAPVTPPTFSVYDEPLVPGQPWWQVLARVAEVAEQAPAAAPAQPRTIDLEAPAPEPGERLGAEAIDAFLLTADTTPETVPDGTAEPTSTGTGLAEQLATISGALGPALLPGSVIAVVGHPNDAREVAAHVAVAAAADPFAIHFASHDETARTASGLPGGRQISSLDEAILRSRRWPSRPTPMVVVVDGRDSRWARTVLDAIETTTVVALPSPTDDEVAVRAWVGELGGVQALLVDDSCVSKPETLALYGIPALRSPWSLDRPGGGR